MASALTAGQTRTQIAAMVAREARVSTRRARANGHANRITKLALYEAAQTLGLTDGTDFSIRTAVSIAKTEARRSGETDLLDL